MLKKIVLALAAAAALGGASTAALAHGRDYDRGRGWGHESRFHPRFHGYQPRRVVVVPAPRVVYAPPPRVAHRSAAPVVVYPAPVYSAPVFSFRLDFPL